MGLFNPLGTFHKGQRSQDVRKEVYFRDSGVVTPRNPYQKGHRAMAVAQSMATESQAQGIVRFLPDISEGEFF